MRSIFPENPQYAKFVFLKKIPRLPLHGYIDLTYRCNNRCRHCWLWTADKIITQKRELRFGEIQSLVKQAKTMGTRHWFISGGEPMHRGDFSDIFDYITSNSMSYALNTNGSLITPKIARLLKRPGFKMVAMYGATAKVHDHITRTPGSFEATMRGVRYLKEAGSRFLFQLIPLRDNYHQFSKMQTLALSLNGKYRIASPWLFLSASNSKNRNTEIMRQRLDPKEIVCFETPNVAEDNSTDFSDHRNCYRGNSRYLFSSCVENGREFHVDAYGMATFCFYVKHPSLRYDFRRGDFVDFWERFLPSLAKRVKINEEYKKSCGSCESRNDCYFCPAHSYLEHRRFTAKIDGLCHISKENKRFKENWRKHHRRYFKIGGITIQFDSDLPIKKNTFHCKFKHFEVNGPGDDGISIRHHFKLPDLKNKDFGEEYYRKAPWAIYKKGNSWIYTGISPVKKDKTIHRIAVFNEDHTRGRIYNDSEKYFRKGSLQSLTLFPTDQILLARLLADRQGLFLHSCGVNFRGTGLLFAGHSEAGKSTMARMLKGKAEILCDDRMIIRELSGGRRGSGFRIYGTWSHGDVPDVSASSAPLKAILFLRKSKDNRLVPLTDSKEVAKRLLAFTIKPFVTADWWDKTLTLIERISLTVPCYELLFDKSGEVVKLLEAL